ncbi:hypothetical protein SFRURICE_004768 [Spodoptera frugiperda]|nr:hypothetical protein SFRURICE_004768 [Spodoptera frugiperda]
MWLIPAIFCVLHVGAHQQDVVIPPYLLASRTKYDIMPPTLIVTRRPRLYDGPMDDIFGPYSPPHHMIPARGEGKTLEDLAKLSNLLRKGDIDIRQLVKFTDLSHDEDFPKAKAPTDEHSYYHDLDLVEQFGNYLRQKTQIKPTDSYDSDPGRQFNALLAVLIALAKIVRSTCADVDAVYDTVYLETVEKNYANGLRNAHKIARAIEEYIRRGHSHIPKLLKLKQELCEEYSSCDRVMDEKIKSNIEIYSKEIEVLESLVHLANTFRDFSEEFNNAAQMRLVLPYLEASKDRVKEYIWSIVNSVEHISDTVVNC